VAEPGRTEFREAIELVAGSGFSAVLTLAYIVYAGRVLGPVAYADFAAALSVIYIVTLALGPVTATTARFVASAAARNDLEGVGALRRRVHSRLLIGSAIAAGGAALASVPIARAFRFASPMTVFVASLAAIAWIYLSFDRGVASGLRRYREYNANTILESGVRLAGAVAVLSFVRSPAAALASYVCGLVVAEVAISVRLRLPGHGVATGGGWRDVLSYSAPMFALMATFALFQNADMLAVKMWFSAGEAGVYGAATTLVRSLGVIAAPLYIYALPHWTTLHERGERVAPALLRLLGLFGALAVVVMSAFFVAPLFLMTTMYGASFSAGSRLLVPLSGVAVVSYAAFFAAQGFASVNRFRFLWIYVLAAALQLAGMALFHGSFIELIQVLFFVQAATALLLILTFVRSGV
jgi:O-antigen/teichoic acid export membrane protein